MKKLVIIGFVTAFGLAVSMNAQSEGFDQSKLYAGGGLAWNTLSLGGLGAGDNAIGFQGFAGYDLSEKKILGDTFGFAVELGYANSGNFNLCTGCRKFNAAGLWLNAVADYEINQDYKVINRLGMDFGDSDGVMMGMGVEYKVDKMISARAEVVMRSGLKSYQINALYRFK